MPELPEVETTARGIAAHILQQQITEVCIRHEQLRWPIPKSLKQTLLGQRVKAITRRGKYILLELDQGTLIVHLGMSGSIRMLSTKQTPQKHDHVDLIFANNICLRFTDPRRFGALLWTENDPNQHVLLKTIGPEPLTADFDGEYLWTVSRRRKVAVKNFLMDSKIVAGIGNIYAVEALFLAGIRPQTPAGKISRKSYTAIAQSVKKVLTQAIKQGGTTLKDFINPSGKPGYFSVALKVYGRGGEPCLQCHQPLKSTRTGQRATVYCARCQK